MGYFNKLTYCHQRQHCFNADNLRFLVSNERESIFSKILMWGQKSSHEQAIIDSKILRSNFSVTPNNDMTGYRFSNYYNLGIEVIRKPIE